MFPLNLSVNKNVKSQFSVQSLYLWDIFQVTAPFIELFSCKVLWCVQALYTCQVILAQCIHAALCVPAHGSRKMGKTGENNICGPSWKHQVALYHSLTWFKNQAIPLCAGFSPCFHPLEPGRLWKGQQGKATQKQMVIIAPPLLWLFSVW